MKFPFENSVPVEWSGPLPHDVDVIVIGGGVIGICTALYLAEDGHRVLLCEKGCVAGEQSSRNWGWIRQQGRDPDELPIMMEANRLWTDLSKQMNEDIGLSRGGVSYIAQTDAQLARYEAWLQVARAHDLDTKVLSPGETRKMFSGLRGSVAGALHTPSDLRAEPWVAVPALARLARRKGVIIRERTAVRALDLEAGRVAGVVTEVGLVRASSVVLAGGAWSALFLRQHGIHLPQLSVRASVAATAPVQHPNESAAAYGKVAFRPRSDGGMSIAPGGFHELFLGPHAVRSAKSFWTLLKSDPFGTRFLPAAPKGYPDEWRSRSLPAQAEVSPFEQIRILNPEPNRRKIYAARDALERAFPAMGRIRLTQMWAGMIDTLPDVVPVVDRVPNMPGLFVGTGMSGHGFGIGPGMGRVLADLVADRAPRHSLHRFRFNRFSDGSTLSLGPAL